MARRVKKKKSTGSRLLKFFVRIFLLVIIVAAVVGGYWVYNLNNQVVAQFEGKKWAVPAHVYSRPQELYPGLKLSQASFIDQLEKLGYRQVKQLNRQASYMVTENSVSLITRPYQFWEENQADMALRIEFAGDRLRSLINLRDSTTVSEVNLEPRLIGSLRPGQHEDRDLIKIDEVPPEFILSLLATEDRKFLKHHGVNFISIARAMLVNFKAGKVVQGGSTITQQLIKNFYLTSDRTIKRKLKEMVMAMLLEFHYEKHDILETYLNEVYLGQAGNRAIHGFQLASKFYFGRPLQELNTHESALLVGLIKGPSYYNPFKNPERALSRRNVVLDLMSAESAIDEEQLNAIKSRPLGIRKNTILSKSAYPSFLDLIRRQLSDQYDEELLQSEGLAIYTTMDLTVQQAADKALRQTIADIESQRNIESGTLQGAIVVLRASSGEILALTSDRDTDYAGFNRALDAKRSIGSLVKPAVYLSAFEQSTNYSLMSTIADSPLTIIDSSNKKWSPGNYDKVFHGNVTLVDALARSYNIPAVRVGMDVGVESVIYTMQQLGLNSQIQNYPSTLLGASQHTPLEVAQMFQTIANDGFKSPLRGILTIQSADNEPLERYPLRSSRVVSAASSYLLDYGLRQVVNRGTAKSLLNQFPAGYAIAGKTGTTNDYRDSWFAGYSSDLVGIVWLGRDDNKSTGLTGASGALKVWQQLFSQLRLREWPDTPPPDISYVSVNKLTGLQTEPGCELAISMPFLAGTEPSQIQSCNQLVDLELPDVTGTLKVPEKVGNVVEEVKDWFQVLFGGGDNSPTQNQKGNNK